MIARAAGRKVRPVRRRAGGVRPSLFIFDHPDYDRAAELVFPDKFAPALRREPLPFRPVCDRRPLDAHHGPGPNVRFGGRHRRRGSGKSKQEEHCVRLPKKHLSAACACLQNGFERRAAHRGWRTDLGGRAASSDDGRGGSCPRDRINSVVATRRPDRRAAAFVRLRS